MKTAKILKEIFFVLGMISLFMMVNNMPTFRESTPQENMTALTSGILFIFFIVLSVLARLIENKKKI